MSVQAYYTGEIEFHLTKNLESIIKANFILLDVGGHHGAFSCIVSKCLSDKNLSGKSYIFEPFPNNYNQIEENLSINNFQKFIEPYNVAVVDCQKEIEIICPKDNNNTDVTIFNKDLNFKHDILKVNMINLDNFVTKTKCHVDLIKIVIQGSECLVVNGAENTIAKYIPILLTEAVESWNQYVNQIKDFLSKHNYQLFGIIKDSKKDSKLCDYKSKNTFVSWDWVALPK